MEDSNKKYMNTEAGDIYYLDEDVPLVPTRVKFRAADILSKLAKWVFFAGVALVVIAFLPSIWYATTPDKLANISSYLGKTAVKPEVVATQEQKPEPKVIYQPKLDSSLPVESIISIPSVKIETTINEASNETFEDALRVGVWRVNDFGTPYDREFPTILAAHRYGYLKWSIPYRLKNSFYNLPKLAVGDTVEITWRQRKYVYEVYAEGKGEEIEDYTADLILYTCESLSSPIRIVKYARLLEI